MRQSQSVIEEIRCLLKVRTRINAICRRLFPPTIEIDSLIPEISTIQPRISSFEPLRINLVVFNINSSLRFGGVQSSIDLAVEISKFLPNIRILVTTNDPDQDAIDSFSGFELVPNSCDSIAPKQIQFIGNPLDRHVLVAQNDIFIPHGWWEAYRVDQWITWQSETFSCTRRPVVFMIQDFEPGIYGFSSRHALAAQTFNTKLPHITVINTALVYEQFKQQGYIFQNVFTFEPRLNLGIRKQLDVYRNTKKEKILLCYCRPSQERNAFELLALALKEWVRIYPNARDWQIVSAGIHHDPIELTPDVKIVSRGKLTLEDYCSLLSRSSVGLSLMISPHPSYPPLEFAHYGLRVLTNGYGGKNISSWHDNIRSTNNLHPEAIAMELAYICALAELDLNKGWEGASHIPEYLSPDTPFHFAEDIAILIKKSVS